MGLRHVYIGEEGGQGKARHSTNRLKSGRYQRFPIIVFIFPCQSTSSPVNKAHIKGLHSETSARQVVDPENVRRIVYYYRPQSQRWCGTTCAANRPVRVVCEQVDLSNRT